jgi:hypothetical protein
VVYERRGLRHGFLLFMYGEFLEEWKRKILYDKKMNNGGQCVKVVGFVAFPFFIFFSFSFVILEPSIMVVI